MIAIENAVKKFITRFLGGGREDEQEENNNLFDFLGREQFWSKSIVDANKDLQEAVCKLGEEFNNKIQIKHVLKFYEILHKHNKDNPIKPKGTKLMLRRESKTQNK